MQLPINSKLSLNHIVLIGFKNVGKSIIAKHLAQQLDIPCIDLDSQIERLYENQFNQKLSCREIAKKIGMNDFRTIEHHALKSAINSKPAVISLGGGTPLSIENQQLLQPFVRIYITAPRGIVYERILMNGRPAFFNQEEPILDTFNRLWNERKKIYQKLKNFTIANNGSIDDAVNKIIKKLHLLGPAL